MFNRRNAILGWVVLQVLKRKLRRRGQQPGRLRRAGRVVLAVLATGAVVLAARRLRGRGGPA